MSNNMEWIEMPFINAAQLINGRAYSQPELLDSGKYKVVRVGNLSGGDRWFYSDMELNEDKYCIKDDLLFSWACNFGPYIWDDEKTIYHYHIWKVKVNTEVIDKKFFYYYLKHTTPYMLGNVNGSVMVHITKGTMEKQIIKIPQNIENQRKIANILSSLDAKIENNNKINANLEAQAAALFKSWFVDFEPFKDGEFVESELGMIPKGWRVGTYEDIIEGTVSGDWGKETPQGNYTHEVACIRGCDFQDMSNGVRGKTPQRYILEKNYITKKLNDKDILVEISGGTPTVSTGRVCLVSEQMLQKYNNDIVCTNFCRVVRPLAGLSAYIYHSWVYKYNKKVMFGYENGTSGIKNFQMKDFLSKEPVLIPSLKCLVKFQKLIDTLQNAIQSNGTENTKLATLRDTLLSKLMSGEIDLNNLSI